MAKVFSLNEILSIFSSSAVYHRLIDEIQKGFINYSNKVVYVAPVVHLGNTDQKTNPLIPAMIGGGDVCLKSGYIVNDTHYVIKIAGGGFRDSQTKTNYPNSGAMLVFSQLTGALNAVLLDNGVLTELRTAAASVLACKYFAPAQITNIGVVGTGIQARYQVQMLRHVIDYQSMPNVTVYVYGRNRAKCDRYQQDMKQQGIACEITNDMHDIGKYCNLIIMCTSARSPVLLEKHLMENRQTPRYRATGLHINCIGADSKGKQELDVAIISKHADLIVVDSKTQCVEIGEIQHAVRNGTIPKQKVLEFGHVLRAENIKRFKRQNKNDRRVTIFDSTGVAVQDVVIAKMVYQTLNNDSKL